METIAQILARELNREQSHIDNVIALLDEGNTIPFIARYRKELHGAMDDTALRTLEERLRYLRGLQERRDTIKKAIDEQGKLTEELMKPGRDPRDELPPVLLRRDVLDIKDLKPGMVLSGTVRNVIDFGVFVDIGVHQDGLVHISQLSDKFLRHPSELVAVGDTVQVTVLDVDEKKHRISLSMKQAK